MRDAIKTSEYESRYKTVKPSEIINTVYLLWLVQKELNDVVSAFRVVEEDK